MSKLPDELKHPSGGERLQGAATDAVRLAYRGLERFPDLVKRHKYIAGGAAVSTSLVVLAERYRTRTILTLDKRHFGVVRPLSGGRFNIVP